MRQIEKLYFGESISRKDQNRIIKKLTLCNKKMKKDFLVIVVSKNARTICELINFDEFAWRVTLQHSLVVVGVVSDYEEFTGYIMNVVKEVLTTNKQVTTERLIKNILGEKEDERKVWEN